MSPIKMSDAFRVVYADAQDTGRWTVVEPPGDLGPGFGDQAVRTWKWTQSAGDCPKLLDGRLRRPFGNYPHDWRAVQVCSGLLAERLRDTHGLRGTGAALRDRSDAEREALRIQIRDEALAWFRRGVAEPPFAAVPQAERDRFWSWLEAYPWLVRFVITEAVTLSIEASLVGSQEAAARIPADVARRVHHRHALAVQSEQGLFASSPDRMLAPPVDVQGHQWDRARTHLLLLAVSSNEALGHAFGEGVYQFWITPDDLRARRFDKVTLTADAY
jgi:hypothetical protein